MHTLGDSPSLTISPQESGPCHIKIDGLGPGFVPEARLISLPESESLFSDGNRQSPASAASLHGREMQPWRAHASPRKTTVQPSVQKLNPPDRQAVSSSTWYRGDGWALEIIAAIFSLYCFVAIVEVLKVYDGQRTPRLPFGITLNAIVSILSTAAKSSIMFGITAAIGETKWDRFSHKDCYHRLLDLEHIDQASRGPLGSFRILVTGTVRSITSVGAILTLLILAVDPFSQQVLRYQQEPKTVVSGSAWTEQVLAPTMFSNNSDPAYVRAINRALWNDEKAYERKAECPTGNCTYPPFKSMGFCVATREVPLDQVSFSGTACSMAHFNTTTGQIVFQNLTNTLMASDNAIDDGIYTCFVSFGGDSRISLNMSSPWVAKNVQGQMQFNWSFPLDFTGPMNFGSSGQDEILGLRSPLLALGRISFSSPSLVDHQSISLRFEKAEQVSISFCAGEYLISVSQGITSTSVANISSSGGFSYSDDTTILGTNATCWTSGSKKAAFPGLQMKQANQGRYIDRLTESPTSNLSFCTDNWGWGADILQLLESQMSFGVHWNLTAADGATNQFGNSSSLWITAGEKSPVINQYAVQQIRSRSVQDISRSMTASLDELFRKYSPHRVTGSYIEYDTVVRVQCIWLTLPLAVDILGLTFLLSVALRTPRYRSPWKSSILAALFHGLHPTGYDGDGLKTITSMEQEAEKTLVNLETSDEGKSFLQKRAADTP